MDRVTAAKVFVDVVYSGSFTATAERLDMSRPMVTRYVEAMENWLQTRLLHRTTRKVSLTTAGERSLPQIERWLKQADTLTSNIAVDGELSGKIRLASSTSFGFSQLISAVNSFMQKHPKVHIDIDLQDSVSDLTEQRIDLAIRIASDPDPSLIGKPIAVCESVLVASPQYLQTHHAIAHPRDLSSHDCLGYKNFERHVWHLSQGDQFESVGIECRLTSNEATALLHGALQGMGISMLPTYLSNIYLQSGQLESVLPNWKPNDLNIYALYSSRKHLSPAVRAFIDHSEDYFKLHPW
ncbi:LysR family transcriptional regulator [Vibrio alginolyticus]|uniref:LysR family transcriptional regulator n=1 Tax=Vibrio alginolyticus TaxID=663 RepID=UPI00215BFCB5|nr:LysR family transcriptional regulator [Vibrio alginolyticus]MCR9338756.1 LysR family transcriptional regulator [Vibrio alginolyticus]MCR9343853.1 LysR family transcriptional regulator [Vibrio alginolyticus]MCR9393892.1 LysR family transcriptional regulator [Vibrio alginolyticus]